MSNKYCYLPGADKISETFHRINNGFDLVEADIDELQSQINNHIDSNSAHNAEDITFESERPTLFNIDNTKEAIEKVDQRVDELVNNPDPNKDLELVDLRNSSIYGVFPTAKARSDNTDNLLSSHLAENEKQFIYMSQYATGDGTDETSKIQAALDASVGKTLIWTKQSGTHYETGPLIIPSNVKIVFEPGTFVKAKAGYGANDRMFRIAGENVAIDGNFATLQMLKDEYVSGEQRHCFFIIGGENIYIKNLVIKDSGGDGILIGPDEWVKFRTAKNIVISNCIIDNHRRQGISIVGAENVTIENCLISNTIGTDPQAGIDVEPNGLDYDNKNILLKGNTLISNVRGILVYNNSFDVAIIDNKIYSGGGISLSRSNESYPSPSVLIKDNTISGVTGGAIYLVNVHDIDIINNTIKSPATFGIYVQRNIANAAYNNRIIGNKIYNPGTNGIAIENTPNCLVSQNHIEGTGEDGISLLSGCNYTQILDNYLKGCNNVAGRGAIDIRTSSYCTVSGNTVRKNGAATSYGVYIQGSCVETVIEGNDFYDSATYAVYSDSTSTVEKTNRWLDGKVSPRRGNFLPTPNMSWLGTIYLKSGSGVDDEIYICIINADGNAVWKKITIA